MKPVKEKPYPEFPLFPHASGQWAKKLNGKMRYFGSDWRIAIKKYLAYLNGPPESLKAAIDRYLESRRKLQQAGEVTFRHVKDMETTLSSLSAAIGPTKTIGEVNSEALLAWRAKLAETNGVVSIDNHVRRVRAFFGWCKREKIVKELPAGDGLRKPSRGVLRRARAAKGSRMFTPDELHRLILCASPQVRAMILLGLNAGLGNADLAGLTTHHLQGKWLVYPRPKTGIERRVPLWPETREALVAIRRDGDDLVFRTKYGHPWTPKNHLGTDSPISAAFTKLCKGLEIHKKGRGFYSLRHVCKTIGEESGDKVASDYILGHVPVSDDMSAVYRERMADKRLIRVVKHIRRWLGLKAFWEKNPAMLKATVAAE